MDILAPDEIMVDKIEEQNLATTTADAPQRLRATDSTERLLPGTPLSADGTLISAHQAASQSSVFEAVSSDQVGANRVKPADSSHLHIDESTQELNDTSELATDEAEAPLDAVPDAPKLSWFDRLQDPGLRRHYTVIGGVFCFCALIMGLTLVDFSKMTRQRATIDTAFKVRLSPPMPELPASMVYASDQYQPAENLIAQNPRLLPIQQTDWNNDLCGFIDYSGKIVIPPKFATAGKFVDGFAPVSIDIREDGSNDPTKTARRWGLIDETGKYVIQPKYASLSEMNQGVVIGSIHGIAQLLKPSGQVVFTAPSSVNLTALGPYFIAQRVNGRMGLIDAEGHWILPIEYDNITKFQIDNYQSQYMTEYIADNVSTEYFKIHKDGKCGVIDSHGRIVLQPKFSDIDSFADGHAVFSNGGNKGLADASGKVLLESQYNSISQFAPLIALKRDYVYSFINSKGQTMHLDSDLIPLPLNTGEWFVDGLGPVLKGGKVGYLNANGQMFIEPKFIWASPFSNGYAIAWDGNYWRFIDKTGEFASPARFFSVSRFKGGKSNVTVPGLLSAFLEASTIEEVNRYIESAKADYTRWRPNASAKK